jgi:hypothetical protein
MTAGRHLLVCGFVAAACIPAPAAGAAGPPLPSAVSGATGVVAPGGDERLITRGAGDGEQTLLVAVRRGDGEVLRSRRVDGRWRVAPATLDGANTGLSADGRVLVLPRPERSFPPPETELAVVDAQELTIRRRITLPGFFTLDAVSPDGRWVYLIHYEGQSIVDYRVRALDTTTGKLAARDIVDPREPDEQMGGLPVTREMSRDGRWAYTLYSGGSETFIHALDTVGRTAACIDLEMLPAEGDFSLIGLGLSPDGGRLRVTSAGDVVATVNTRTFAVREPGEPAEAFAFEPDENAAAPPRRASAQPADDGGGFPWLLLLPAAGLAGLALLIRRPRGRSPA